MEEDVDTRARATPNFDLHSVTNSRDANQTSCPKKQISKTDHVDEWSASTRSLVDCSDLEDDVVKTIYCNDWKEAVTGWRPTAPCVKYAWIEPKKHSSVDGTGESKKNRVVKAQKHQEKEINWRYTVEPGTYRYSPGGFHSKIVDPWPSEHFANSDESKLLIHLERVRDHFERTLKCANKPMKYPSWREIKSDLNKSQALQSSASEDKIKESSIQTDSHIKRESSIHDIKEEDFIPAAKSAEVVAESSSSVQQESGNHNLQEYHVHKVEINDPFRNYVHDDHSSQRRHHLCLTHVKEDRMLQLQPDMPRGWESSNSSTLLHEADLLLDLNPLQKLTPQQRRIRDDHEFAEIRLSRSDDSTEHPSSSNSNFEIVKGSSGEKPKYRVLPTERYEQLCFRLDKDSDEKQFNKDTFSQYSQKDFALAKELLSVQEIFQAQKYLSHQLKKKPNTKKRKPHRLRALPSSAMRGAGDLPNPGDLGEPLHRGIIDRKTASDLATELLPGVSGQGVNLLYANTRIV